MLNRPYIGIPLEELQARLKNEPPNSGERSIILDEIEQRRTGEIIRSMRDDIKKLTKPHWTLVPGFWIIFAVMVLAAIAAWPVVQGWLQSSPPAHTSSSSS